VWPTLSVRAARVLSAEGLPAEAVRPLPRARALTVLSVRTAAMLSGLVVLFSSAQVPLLLSVPVRPVCSRADSAAALWALMLRCAHSASSSRHDGSM